MGITIAYKGKLRDPVLVPDLVTDLAAKAKAAGWLCKTMSELVAEDIVSCSDLQGITLYPHEECEPLHFHFDAGGTFVNHSYASLLSDTKTANMMRKALAESFALTRRLTGDGPKEKASRRGRGVAGAAGGPHVSVSIPRLPQVPGTDFFKEGSRYNWTKTQFAGAGVHAAVCAILRYVKERYAPDLEVTDDSGYFVDGDYDKLQGQLAYIDRITSLTSQAIEAAAASSTGPMTLDAFVDRINEELAEARNRLH